MRPASYAGTTAERAHAPGHMPRLAPWTILRLLKAELLSAAVRRDGRR